MGTYYPYGATKQDIIKECCEGYNIGTQGTARTIKKCLRGNVLWRVLELYSKPAGIIERIICCDLLSTANGDWGYKPMDESMGPFYYSCPLSYLDGTRVLNKEWREGVREHHKRNSERKRSRKCQK